MTAPSDADPRFVAAAEGWLAACQKLVSDYHVAHYPNIPDTTLSLKWGQRYIKVIADDAAGRGQRSVWAFLDQTTGDVLKAASWKAPAPHARGNLFDETGGLGRVGPYGPEYLR